MYHTGNFLVFAFPYALKKVNRQGMISGASYMSKIVSVAGWVAQDQANLPTRLQPGWWYLEPGRYPITANFKLLVQSAISCMTAKSAALQSHHCIESAGREGQIPSVFCCRVDPALKQKKNVISAAGGVYPLCRLLHDHCSSCHNSWHSLLPSKGYTLILIHDFQLKSKQKLINLKMKPANWAMCCCWYRKKTSSSTYRLRLQPTQIIKC